MVKKTYTREFKLKVVRPGEGSDLRPAQACREYQLAESVLDRWRHEVRLQGEAAFTPLEGQTATPDYGQRIDELERVCGQLAVENAALKKRCSLPSPSAACPLECAAPGVPEPVVNRFCTLTISNFCAILSSVAIC
jgi:transposase-like protein